MGSGCEPGLTAELGSLWPRAGWLPILERPRCKAAPLWAWQCPLTGGVDPETAL